MKRKSILILVLVLITLGFTTYKVLGLQAFAASSSAGSLITPTPQPTRMPDDVRSSFLKDQLSEENSLRASSPVRGIPDDTWADVIIGQPGFNQITPNEVVGNKLFNPGGVYVDRSSLPNRVYVYDSGNSRILGFSSLGLCAAGSKAGQDCTSNSDCPASTCTIDNDKPADIILGQPSANSSACNGDSAYQHYPDLPAPSAQSLCGLRADSISILEGGSQMTMASDSQGNFYTADFFNNRVLRYNDPFDSDPAADYVWGQTGFASADCNGGAGFGSPTNQSLCLASWVGDGNTKTGVAVDAQGNMWVADTQNNRVLRFPYVPALGAPSQTANLVLGQPNFTTAAPGGGLNQMGRPRSVRVDANGNVFVADGESYWTHTTPRILIFHPPLTNGMAASHVIQEGMGEPPAVELDPSAGFWVNDCATQRVLHLDKDGNLLQTVSGIPSGVYGGLGIDRDGNIMLTGWDPQEIMVYSPPTYQWASTFLQADEFGSFNKLGSRGATDPIGLEVTDSQLIIADVSRLLFWNNPTQLTSNYPPADGVVGQPDFTTRPRWDPGLGRIRADTLGRLWVVKNYGDSSADLLAYQLPLVTGAEPIIEISSPIALLGGGTFDWTWTLKLTGLVYQPQCDCLWLSDSDNNRVFRIRNVSTAQRAVDIVLGQKQDPSDLTIGTHCNQGRDSDNGYIHPTSPSRDSLCHPGGLALDSRGNLFVADHNLEVAGNKRLLEYDASSLPMFPTTALFAIPASRVYGRNGSFTGPDCLYEDPMCGPWEPVFYPDNRMVIGFNGYLGPHFPQIYNDPLSNHLPFSSLSDYYSHAFSIRLVSLNNLYVLDLTRNRVLIYHATTFTISGDAGAAGAAVHYAVNGSPKTVTADAIGNYRITVPNHWSGTVTPTKTGDSFIPASRDYTNVTADKTGQDYTASLNIYLLSVNKTGSGSGMISSSPVGINCGSTCTYAFPYSTTVVLTAFPVSPSTFGGWSGGGCSGTGACTLSMSSAQTVTAIFNAPGYQILAVSKAGSGSGEVTSKPAGIDCGSTCLASFDENIPVTLTAVPTLPSTFGWWSGAGCSGSGTCTVSMQTAQFVTAAFNSPGEYILTVNKSGTGSGTVTSSPVGISCGSNCMYAFNGNTVVALTAEAGTGSDFRGWSGGGCSGSGPCSVAMNGDHAITADFVSQCSDCGPANSAWPLYRQNLARTGRSPLPGIQDPLWYWSYYGGSYGGSSPIIGPDNTIFAGLGNKLFAFTPSGEVKWSYAAQGMVKSPAIAANGTIYAGSDAGILYAIKADGTLNWSFPTGSWMNASPAISPEGIIYIGSADEYFYALWPDGTLKWSYRIGSWQNPSPAIAPDGTIYQGSTTGSVYAFTPAGKLKWEYPTGGFIDSSPAVGEDGTVYIGSGDFFLYALNPNGTLKWKYNTGDTALSAAIGADGTIYVGSGDNYLYAISPGGTLKWRYLTGGRVGTPSIDDNGVIYVGSFDGYLYAINPSGALEWRILLGGWLVGNPVIGPNQTIYITEDGGTIFAVVSRNPQYLPLVER